MNIILGCTARQEKNAEDLTEIYSLMFKDALKNQSTAPDFVVYFAKNSKTEETKEICTTTDQIYFGKLVDDKSRTVVFSDEKYKQIGANSYDNRLVDSIFYSLKETSIDSIVRENNELGYSKTLENYSTKYSNGYFEHVLYRNKILTNRKESLLIFVKTQSFYQI
jgi:hypothetical protein